MYHLARMCMPKVKKPSGECARIDDTCRVDGKPTRSRVGGIRPEPPRVSVSTLDPFKRMARITSTPPEEVAVQTTPHREGILAETESSNKRIKSTGASSASAYSLRVVPWVSMPAKLLAFSKGNPTRTAFAGLPHGLSSVPTGTPVCRSIFCVEGLREVLNCSIQETTLVSGTHTSYIFISVPEE